MKSMGNHHHGGGQQNFEKVRAQIAEQLFPEADMNDSDVRRTLDFLEDCVEQKCILEPSRFYHIFKIIPREFIDKAITIERAPLVDVIVLCAKVQGDEIRRIRYRREVQDVPRIKYSEGHRHRGAPPS